MRFPVIKVRDKFFKGDGFIVGASAHHKLVLSERGEIRFLDTLCMDSTGGFGGYEFVAEQGCYGYEIEMVTFDELLDIYREQIQLSCKRERLIRDATDLYINEQAKRYELYNEDGTVHTAGIMQE